MQVAFQQHDQAGRSEAFHCTQSHACGVTDPCFNTAGKIAHPVMLPEHQGLPRHDTSPTQEAARNENTRGAKCTHQWCPALHSCLGWELPTGHTVSPATQLMQLRTHAQRRSRLLFQACLSVCLYYLAWRHCERCYSTASPHLHSV